MNAAIDDAAGTPAATRATSAGSTTSAAASRAAAAASSTGTPRRGPSSWPSWPLDAGHQHVHPRHRRPGRRSAGSPPRSRPRSATLRRRRARHGVADVRARSAAATRGHDGTSTPRRDRATVGRSRPTPDDGTRLSDERLWDEATRPTRPGAGPRARPTPRTSRPPAAAPRRRARRTCAPSWPSCATSSSRSRAGDARRRRRPARTINTMTHAAEQLDARRLLRVRTAGSSPAHHTLEDPSMFPHLRARDPRLAPVVDRLAARSTTSSTTCSSSVDRALVALSADEPDGARRAPAPRSTCSPTRCSRTCPTRSASSWSRWPASVSPDLSSHPTGRSTADLLEKVPRIGCGSCVDPHDLAQRVRVTALRHGM